LSNPDHRQTNRRTWKHDLPGEGTN